MNKFTSIFIGLINAKLKDISEIEKTNTIQINKSIGLSEEKKKEIEKYLEPNNF